MSDTIDRIIEAMKKVGDDYFHVKEAGANEWRLKERVYCYELYHQLRILFQNGISAKSLVIFGETDKSGHRHFKRNPKTKGFKPDFIVHKPGDMENNQMVIEIKRIDANYGDILDDVRKLFLTLEHHKYQTGILVIFGNRRERKMKRIVGEIESSYGNRINVLWHKEPGMVSREISSGE